MKVSLKMGVLRVKKFVPSTIVIDMEFFVVVFFRKNCHILINHNQ